MFILIQFHKDIKCLYNYFYHSLMNKKNFKNHSKTPDISSALQTVTRMLKQQKIHNSLLCFLLSPTFGRHNDKVLEP